MQHAAKEHEVISIYKLTVVAKKVYDDIVSLSFAAVDAIDAYDCVATSRGPARPICCDVEIISRLKAFCSKSCLDGNVENR